MTFQEPTFEEFEKATDFARFRYKWGLVVTILAWITLIILIIFVFVYANELSTRPAYYIVGKYDLGNCFCQNYETELVYYLNETSFIWKEGSF